MKRFLALLALSLSTSVFATGPSDNVVVDSYAYPSVKVGDSTGYLTQHYQQQGGIGIGGSASSASTEHIAESFYAVNETGGRMVFSLMDCKPDVPRLRHPSYARHISTVDARTGVVIDGCWYWSGEGKIFVGWKTGQIATYDTRHFSVEEYVDAFTVDPAATRRAASSQNPSQTQNQSSQNASASGEVNAKSYQSQNSVLVMPSIAPSVSQDGCFREPAQLNNGVLTHGKRFDPKCAPLERR